MEIRFTIQNFSIHSRQFSFNACDDNEAND